MDAEFVTPEWVKDAVFYQIFPDRFAKSEHLAKPNNLEAWEATPTVYGFKGGDLLGVSEHLDYLHDLGITAIYFNPIFQSASNHRYHTHDYLQVDPLLGGNPAFRLLLDQAHRRGIRIVLDGVFNHASRGFFQFNHILETGPASPYLDWFIVHNFPLNAYSGHPNYETWVGLPALPKFNTDNPQVRAFILNVARYWLEQGIDGWRLDVPFEIKDPEFWREFRRVVKGINPEAYIVGEIPWEAQAWLQGDQFDAVMNYQFTQACLGFFAGEHIDRRLEAGMMGLPPTPVLAAPAFARRVEELLTIYPQPAVSVQLNLIDSHDMPRFLALSQYDRSAERLAVLFQMTYPGAPCVYYGDEIGLKNGPRDIPEDCRYAFPWDPEQWDQEMLAYYKACIALRHAHPALRRGEYISLYSSGQVYVYLRRLGSEILLVALNAGEQPADLDLSALPGLPQGRGWQRLLGSDQYGVLPARSGAVWQSL